jgi:zinc D-Ala-D-Ala carboxypeptidase
MKLLLETANFSAAELRCRCGCAYAGMDSIFLTMCQELREEVDISLPVTSAVRCPTHNNKVSGTGFHGPHTTLRAIDFGVRGAEAVILSEAAHRYTYTQNGEVYYFTGFGYNQKGPHEGRFVHLDNLKPGETKGPRPWIWTY